MRRALIVTVLMAAFAVVNTGLGPAVAEMPSIPPPGCVIAELREEGPQRGGEGVIELRVLPTGQAGWQAQVDVVATDYLVSNSRLVWVDASGAPQIEDPAPFGQTRIGTFHYLGVLACQVACLASPPTMPGTPGTSPPEPDCVPSSSTTSSTIPRSTTTSATGSGQSSTLGPVSTAPVDPATATASPSVAVATPRFTG